MAETAKATDGANLPLESLETSFTYNGDLVTSISVVYDNVTYIQTLTYANDNVVNISQWEAQP